MNKNVTMRLELNSQDLPYRDVLTIGLFSVVTERGYNAR